MASSAAICPTAIRRFTSALMLGFARNSATLDRAESYPDLGCVSSQARVPFMCRKYLFNTALSLGVKGFSSGFFSFFVIAYSISLFHPSLVFIMGGSCGRGKPGIDCFSLSAFSMSNRCSSQVNGLGGNMGLLVITSKRRNIICFIIVLECRDSYIVN